MKKSRKIWIYFDISVFFCTFAGRTAKQTDDITMEGKRKWTAAEAAKAFQAMLDAKKQWLEEINQAEASLAL